MATLQTLLASALAPSQEAAISTMAVSTLSLLRSGTVFVQADENTISKFNVRVSAFLNNKKPMAKWFGAHLAMVAVDSNWNILKSNGAKWTKLLLKILETNEPLATKEVAIKALSTIFAKTFGKQEFTRDITTPHISPFLKLLFKHAQITEESVVIKNDSSNSQEEFIQLDDSDEEDDTLSFKKPSEDDSLISLSSQSELLNTIVPAINQILKQQSTTFRPFSGRYLALISRIISLSYTNPSVIDPTLLKQTCQGYALLHYSAPKDSESLTWRLGAKHIVAHLHQTINSVSKSFVDEDFEIFADSENISKNTSGGVDTPLLALSPIKETSKSQLLAQTTDKLQVLFHLLLAFLSTPTKTAVKLPLGTIINLVDRSLSLSQFTSELPRVEKNHRELFVTLLDALHFEALNAIYKLVPLTQTMLLCHSETIMHHLEVHLQPQPVLYESEDLFRDTTKVQLKVLQLATVFFPLLAPISKSKVPVVNKMVEEAIKLVTSCRDPSSLKLADAVNNPHLFVYHPSSAQVSLVAKFLQSLIVTVPELSLPTRALIDRWFIIAASAACVGSGVNGSTYNLTSNLQGIISHSLSISAAFPGSSKYSILPMASRLVQNSALMNNMIHPLLPPKATVTKNLESSAALQPRNAFEKTNEEEEGSGQAESLEKEERPTTQTKTNSEKCVELKEPRERLFDNTRKRKHAATNDGADVLDVQVQTKSKISKTSKSIHQRRTGLDIPDGDNKNSKDNNSSYGDSDLDEVTAKPTRHYRTRSNSSNTRKKNDQGVSNVAFQPGVLNELDYPVAGPPIDVDVEYERSHSINQVLTRSEKRQLEGKGQKSNQNTTSELREVEEIKEIVDVSDDDYSNQDDEAVKDAEMGDDDRNSSKVETGKCENEASAEIEGNENRETVKVVERLEKQVQEKEEDDDEFVIPSIDLDTSDEED